MFKFHGSWIKESVGLRWENKAMKTKLCVAYQRNNNKPRTHVRELYKITSQ